VFTTQKPLQEPLAVMGQLKAVLYVSTDRPDTDFYVSLTDVHPDGASMQIRSGIRRMKWRESTEFRTVQTETDANKIYRVEIDMWFTSYVIAPGHRLRVVLGSSNTPYYAKSDNSGQDELGFKYDKPATNRIYWSEEYPSHVELPIVDLADLPKNDQF
jgi:putative CocE/NonD family hydrolase